MYGNRGDLPRRHMDTPIRAGYIIVPYDYPLASVVRSDTIVGDVCSSATHYINHPEIYYGRKLLFFLWGHSAGAYLCLLAGVRGNLSAVPAGILSYYGYGLLRDHQYKTPSEFYCSFPVVNALCPEQVGADLHMAGSLGTHYSIYVYVRQTGSWCSPLYEDRDKHFYLDHILRACIALPCPPFCVHGACDDGMPYGKFLELSDRLRLWQSTTSCDGRSSDRDEGSPFTEKLLDGILAFLEENPRLSPAQC